MNEKSQTHNSLRLYRILIKSSTQVELVTVVDFSPAENCVRAAERKKGRKNATNMKPEISATVGCDYFNHDDDEDDPCTSILIFCAFFAVGI